MGLPLQQDADMSEPGEHVAWALVNIGGTLDAPLLLPLPALKSWSEHLYKCGFRHHPELQEIFYRPPKADASVLEAGAGQWVTSDTPGCNPLDGEDDVDRMIDELPEEIIQRIIQRKG